MKTKRRQRSYRGEFNGVSFIHSGLNGGSDNFFPTFGLIYSAAGVLGDRMLKSGNYSQLNGRIGNFNNKPFNKLSQWGKANKAFSQNLSKFGKIANGVVIATAVYDVLDDGNLKTSTAINTTLTAIAIGFPVTAPFVLAYGILDFAFGISEYIDSRSSGINTGIYDRKNL